MDQSILLYRLNAAAKKITSTQIDNSVNPIWREHLYLPISLPSISSFVKLKLYDFDSGKKDELVGSVYFEIKDIQEGKFREATWINIYGSQHGGD